MAFHRELENKGKKSSVYGTFEVVKPILTLTSTSSIQFNFVQFNSVEFSSIQFNLLLNSAMLQEEKYRQTQSMVQEKI